MSEIHFVGKTRYEDLTETGSLINTSNWQLKIFFCLWRRGIFAVSQEMDSSARETIMES